MPEQRTTVKLHFINRHYDEPIHNVVHVTPESVDHVVRWYMAYNAGDPIDVFKDGQPHEVDANGERLNKELVL